MTSQLYNYLYVANIMLSLFALIEITIYFKRPIFLKAIFTLLISSIFITNISLLYSSYYGYNRWLIELPKTIMLISIFNLMSFLSYHQVKRFVLIISIVIFSTHTTALIYFEFVHPISTHKQIIYENHVGLFIRILKFSIILVIFFLLTRFYRNIIKLKTTENYFYVQLKSWFKIALFIMLFLGVTLNLFVVIKPKIEFEKIFPSINSLFLCFLILLRPRFLNRTNIKLAMRGTFATHSQKNLDKEIFFIEFFNNYYFLQSNSNLANFAQKLNITPELLNDFILEHYSLNFTDLINKSRVDYFVELAKSGDFIHWTIIALSEKSGFGSQPSLNRAFRRFHGGTPSDFIKSLG